MMTNNNIMLERRELIRFFNELRTHRIIAVCAPAGYGKTVAVAQWLDKYAYAKTIFTVDEYDNNMASFCERFCAALRTCQPQNKTLINIISHAFFHSAPDEFTLRAVSALSGRKQTVFVIDDLHLIHNREILKLLLIFIKRLPDNFQIVLISRNDMQYDLSDLWMKGHVICVDMRRLLFTDKDIADLYKKRGGGITQEQAKDICRQTQGWAIGINAFMLSGGESTDKVYNYLDDFIQSNIWEKWDYTTRDFMLRTANLRELTPSLCNVVADTNHSDKVLEALVYEGAFVMQVQKSVYRYHHLFQNFLLRMVAELGDEFLQSILDTEGYWHLSQEDFFSAVDCFMRSKNHNGIAKCFDLPKFSKQNIFVADKLFPILRHRETLNTAKVYPYLLYLMIWYSYAEGNADEMIFFMDEYYAKHHEIAANYPAYAHEINAVRILDFRTPLSSILNEINMPSDMSNLAIYQWKITMHMPLLHRGILDSSQVATEDAAKYMNDVIVPKVGWLYGYASSMLADSFVAGILYEQGHLLRAYEYSLKANAALKASTFSDTKFSLMLMLVCILESIGESDEAAEVMKSVLLMIEECNAFHLIYNFNAFTARRKFVKGDFTAANEWINAQPFSGRTLRGIYADFTTCRALIMVEKYGAAIILLEKILKLARDFNRPLDILEAQILLAIAYWKKKRKFQNDALNYLESAVLTAYPYGYVQMFVNDGIELASMLYKLIKRVEQRTIQEKKHINFIKTINFMVCGNKSSDLTNRSEERPLKFTDKQKVVMNLLSQGKVHKEIAASLNIKPSSLRSHLESIYSKLDVTSATDAIVKMNEMGVVWNIKQ